MTGYQIVQARQAVGLSQEELAELVGVTQTLLSRVERGMRPLPQDTEASIRRAILVRRRQADQVLRSLGILDRAGADA